MNRINLFGLFLFCFFLSLNARELEITVNMDGKVGVVDNTGAEVIPHQWVEIARWGEYFKVSDGKKYGLLNSSGEEILAVDYHVVGNLNCYGKAFICKGGKVAKDSNGKSTITGGKFGLIDNSGKIIIPAEHKSLCEFALSGSSVVCLYEGLFLNSGVYGPSDTLVTACKYVGVSNSPHAYGAAIMDGNTGIELVPMNKCGFAAEPKGDMVRYYDVKGKKILCGYYDIKNSRSFIVREFQGDFSTLQFWTHGDFNGVMAPVNGNNEWVFIDKEGNTLRKGYSKLFHSEPAKSWVVWTADNKTEAYTENNDSIPFLFGHQVVNTSSDMENRVLYFVKRQDGLFGVLDTTGQEIIPFEYENMDLTVKGYIPVMKNNLWGIITEDNQPVVPIEYKAVFLPIERNQTNFMVRSTDNNIYNFHAPSGTLNAQAFSQCTSFSNGMAWVTIPNDSAPNTYLNRVMAQSTVEDFNQKAAMNFGYIIDKNNNVVFPMPIPVGYTELAIQAILRKGMPLTISEAHREVLEFTKHLRHYGIKEDIEENDWDF